MDILKDYLKFEAEFIQDELEAYEQSLSERDGFIVRSKRLEAKTAWEMMGKKPPRGLTFHV
jgi:hypothetical protein